jgi:hypothetical protein
VYIYYQQSYEAREQIEKRSRQARAKRIIRRYSRSRRERRRRRAQVAEALKPLFRTGLNVGLGPERHRQRARRDSLRARFYAGAVTA